MFNNKIVMFGLAAGVFLFTQAVLILLDTCKGPGEVAQAYTRAMYRLDPDMADFLCTANEVEGRVAVNDYIYQMQTESEEWGHQPDYIRSQLIHVHTRVEPLDTDAVLVHVSGKRKRLINPVFTWAGRLFNLGNTCEFDHQIELIRENGHWKVCNIPLELAKL